MNEITKFEIPEEIKDICSKVDESSACFIAEKFTPYIEKIREYRNIADKFIITSEDDKQGMKEAKESRLLIMKVRTNADKTRSELKANALSYGNAVQSIYNLIKSELEPIEEHLKKQELFAETANAERISQLKEKRIADTIHLKDFIVYGVDYGTISEEDFQKIVLGAEHCKAKHEEDILKAEEDKKNAEIEAERKALEEAKERDRISKENEELKRQAEADRKAREEAEAKHREEQRLLQAEIDRQAEADRKAREEAEAKLKERATAGDKRKIEIMLQDLGELKSKIPTCENTEFISISNSVLYLLKKLKSLL